MILNDYFTSPCDIFISAWSNRRTLLTIFFGSPCAGCFCNQECSSGVHMQGTKIRLLTGGLLMMAAAGYVQAEALQPDPAWQQGTLANGLQWQVLATPQRPSDRIEVRLFVNIGGV